MRAEPISPTLLADQVADRIADVAAPWVRVAVDGAPGASPGLLADDLVDRLRLRGRAVLRVSADDFLRPASLRLEFGRTDPDVLYDEWLDTRGLTREVLAPLADGGTGRVLPALWDSATDRASRAGYVDLPRGGVLLLDGALLLGRGLAFDFTVHLWMSAAALARRTDAKRAWTLPAYARYEREAEPIAAADVAVRVDDPKHPAVIRRE
jgi:hypothetical protein